MKNKKRRTAKKTEKYMSPPIHDELSATDNRSMLHKVFLGPPAAAAIAALLEVSIFLPADTISKRLMGHQQRVIALSDPSGSLHRLQNVILQQPMPKANEKMSTSSAAAAPLRPLDVVKSLFSGTRWAMAYKAGTRCVKFGFQPQVKDAMQRGGVVDTFQKKFGKKPGKILAESLSGSIVGCFEIIFIPFDRMKILSQTNAGALKGRGFFSILQQEGIRTLYAGSATTLVRNIPGSFALFFGTSFMKDNVFMLEDYRQATFLQNTIASSVGATLGVIVTSPLDIVKTRVMNKSFGSNHRGMSIFLETVKNEGFSAFWKGIVPKVISVGPRLVFTYTVTQHIAGWMRRTTTTN